MGKGGCVSGPHSTSLRRLHPLRGFLPSLCSISVLLEAGSRAPIPWGGCDHLGTSGNSFPAFGCSGSHQVPALQESSCIGRRCQGAVISWSCLGCASRGGGAVQPPRSAVGLCRGKGRPCCFSLLVLRDALPAPQHAAWPGSNCSREESRVPSAPSCGGIPLPLCGFTWHPSLPPVPACVLHADALRALTPRALAPSTGACCPAPPAKDGDGGDPVPLPATSDADGGWRQCQGGGLEAQTHPWQELPHLVPLPAPAWAAPSVPEHPWGALPRTHRHVPETRGRQPPRPPSRVPRGSCWSPAAVGASALAPLGFRACGCSCPPVSGPAPAAALGPVSLPAGG